MQSLSRFEAFVRGRSPEYRAQMQIFQDANREIVLQAKRKSVEGAALGFTQLTISCVNCHKNLRSPQAQDSPERKSD
jgi:cytochrome c556